MCTKCNFPCYQQSSLSARFLGCLSVTQPQASKTDCFCPPLVLAPKPNAFVQGLRKLTSFHDEHYAQQTGLYDFYDTPEKTLVLP